MVFAVSVCSWTNGLEFLAVGRSGQFTNHWTAQKQTLNGVVLSNVLHDIASSWQPRQQVKSRETKIIIASELSKPTKLNWTDIIVLVSHSIPVLWLAYRLRCARRLQATFVGVFTVSRIITKDSILLYISCKIFSSYTFAEMVFLTFRHFLKGSKLKRFISIRLQATALYYNIGPKNEQNIHKGIERQRYRFTACDIVIVNDCFSVVNPTTAPLQ